MHRIGQLGTLLARLGIVQNRIQHSLRYLCSRSTFTKDHPLSLNLIIPHSKNPETIYFRNLKELSELIKSSYQGHLRGPGPDGPSQIIFPGKQSMMRILKKMRRILGMVWYLKMEIIWLSSPVKINKYLRIYRVFATLGSLCFSQHFSHLREFWFSLWNYSIPVWNAFTSQHAEVEIRAFCCDSWIEFRSVGSMWTS